MPQFLKLESYLINENHITHIEKGPSTNLVKDRFFIYITGRNSPIAVTKSDNHCHSDDSLSDYDVVAAFIRYAGEG